MLLPIVHFCNGSHQTLCWWEMEWKIKYAMKIIYFFWHFSFLPVCNSGVAEMGRWVGVGGITGGLESGTNAQRKPFCHKLGLKFEWIVPLTSNSHVPLPLEGLDLKSLRQLDGMKKKVYNGNDLFCLLYFFICVVFSTCMSHCCQIYGCGSPSAPCNVIEKLVLTNKKGTLLYLHSNWIWLWSDHVSEI